MLISYFRAVDPLQPTLFPHPLARNCLDSPFFWFVYVYAYGVVFPFPSRYHARRMGLPKGLLLSSFSICFRKETEQQSIAFKDPGLWL